MEPKLEVTRRGKTLRVFLVCGGERHLLWVTQSSEADARKEAIQAAANDLRMISKVYAKVIE